MALSGAQTGLLQSHHQRMKCRFVTFPAISAINVAAVATGAYSFTDMVNVYPRYSWVACDGAITIDANESQQRDKSAATGHAFTKDSGDGTVTDNSDGTCTYTAPSSGTGICYINCATDGNATGVTCAVAYGELTALSIGQVTSFSADLGSGAWELTVRGYGSCTGLERQKGILLVVDDYWEGVENTFGGYQWPHGIFFGWVERYRRVYQDVHTAYVEIQIVSAKTIINQGTTPDAYFSRTDTDGIVVADFEAIDAAWIFIQESGLNDKVNFWFMDDGQACTTLKLETGKMMDVIDDVLGRTFGVVTSTKLGDIFLQGDPDIRLSKLFNQTPEFSIDEDLFQSIDFTFHYMLDVDTPADRPVSQVTLEATDGALDNIVKHWPTVLRDGTHETVSGLICEAEATLEVWAEKYWWKVNRHMEGSASWFLMHHVDLLTLLGWSTTIRAADLSNYDLPASLGTGVYVDSINYTINPGTGTWTGSTHFLSYYDPGS